MKTPSYEEIRRRVERRYNRLFWFAAHIIVAFSVIFVIWQADPTPQNRNVLIGVPWLGLILIHGIKVYMEGRKEQAVEHMWQRYYGNLDVDDIVIIDEEKPKRFARLEDGHEEDMESLYQQNGHGTFKQKKLS